MKFDEKKLQADLQKLSPEEKVKYLESLAEQAKKELFDTETALKKSQELLEKQRQNMLKNVLREEQVLLAERERQQRTEKEKKELSSMLEKQGTDLEANIEKEQARLPATHPIVGLYTQLRGIQQYYQEHQEVDYARAIVLAEIRKDVVDVLNKYQEVPEEMKEIADATYRLVKGLLNQSASDRTRYEP